MEQYIQFSENDKFCDYRRMTYSHEIYTIIFRTKEF